MRPLLWPALLVTILTGMGFAGLKFVLIGEIALDFDRENPPHMAYAWMDQILHNAIRLDIVDEAITQGLAAVLTSGVLVGFLINSPLAGAWRVSRLFVISSALVAVGTLLTLRFNPWLIAWLVGIAYGTACAARGKAVPLLAAATGRSNTAVSGLINASLVISLLLGTFCGMQLHANLHEKWQRHAVLFVFMVIATLISFKVDPPEPKPIPFTTGMRDLLRGTTTMFRGYWALLVGGGLAWGVASAAVLASFIDAITRLNLKPEKAVFLVIFPMVGAILGNLASHKMERRRWVILGYLGLAACIYFFQFVVQGMFTGAIMMLVIGFCFAAPTNVLDARLLAAAAAEGQPGLGSTVMSLIHNCFILLIGSGLSLALFLGVMTAAEQFTSLAAVCVVICVVVLKTQIKDRVAPGTATLVKRQATGVPEGA
jgi:predicted MFS family arabinose efflux permease